MSTADKQHSPSVTYRGFPFGSFFEVRSVFSLGGCSRRCSNEMINAIVSLFRFRNLRKIWFKQPLHRQLQEDFSPRGTCSSAVGRQQRAKSFIYHWNVEPGNGIGKDNRNILLTRNGSLNVLANRADGPDNLQGSCYVRRHSVHNKTPEGRSRNRLSSHSRAHFGS